MHVTPTTSVAQPIDVLDTTTEQRPHMTSVILLDKKTRSYKYGRNPDGGTGPP